MFVSGRAINFLNGFKKPIALKATIFANLNGMECYLIPNRTVTMTFYLRYLFMIEAMKVKVSLSAQLI